MKFKKFTTEKYIMCTYVSLKYEHYIVYIAINADYVLSMTIFDTLKKDPIDSLIYDISSKFFIQQPQKENIKNHVNHNINELLSLYSKEHGL